MRSISRKCKRKRRRKRSYRRKWATSKRAVLFVECGVLMHIKAGKSWLSTGSVSANTPTAKPTSAPVSLPLPTHVSFQTERPPLDFSHKSSPDGVAQSPPKDLQVMHDLNENLENGSGI